MAGRTIGRPAVYGERVQTVVRITPDTLERLKAEAAEREVSVNFLVSRAVDQYLEALAPVEEAVGRPA